jgi:8-oxo-dGTP pyrophosphatase MutT (NUDIX family)
MAGAGFVLFRKDTMNQPEPLMLTLINNKGHLDIPKGHRDGNESPIDTAIRECFEECSIIIDKSSTIYGERKNGPLTLFCATTDQVPTITRNPDTGLIEHQGWKWVTKKQFMSGCLDYLKPGVDFFYSMHSRSYNP